jgi:hypothetical protein
VGEEPVAEESAPSVPDKSYDHGPDGGTGAVIGVRSATAVLAAPVASAASVVRRRYLPAVRRRYGRVWWLPGWLFAAVTQLPALLAMAWLLPGTGMLLAGRLLPLPLLIIFLPLALALCYFAMRQLPVSWPRFGAERDEARDDAVRDSAERNDAARDDSARPAGAVQPAEPGEKRRPDVPSTALLATVAIAVGFAVWQVVVNSQQLIVVSDPGAYLQYGYWIAQHGTARIPQTAAAFGSATGLNFASTGFFQSGTTVTPAFMPGLPLVLAAGTWLGGVQGALLMPPVIGGCAVLSFGGLVGRLAGPRWAPAGALVLALTLPEQYVSRAPFSEPLVQVLLFGGLCLLVDSLVVTRLRNGNVAAMTLAGLGGLALGLTVLVNIGSLSILLPAFPFLAVMFVARRPQAGPLGLGLLLGVGLSLWAGLALARPYLSALSSQLHVFGLCAAGFGVATALVAPLAFPGVRTWVRRVVSARPRVVGLQGETVKLPSLGTCLQAAALCLPILLLIGFAIRPAFQTTRGQTDPTVIRYVAGLQRLENLPVDGRRQYYESSLNWVLWYLGIPAVLLATAGAALLGRRMVRAALAWRDSLLPARMWALPYLIIGWSVVTVLWDPAELPQQPWASHRLVPVVLPGLVLLGIWASSRLKARAAALGAGRVTAVLAAVCCVLAMAIPAFVTSVNPGLAPHASVSAHSSGLSKFISRVQFRGLGVSATYRGSVAAVNRLCSAIGPNASVVFVDAASADSLAQVVRGYCDVPAASAAYASTAALEQVVTSVEQAGHHPVLLGETRARLALFGIVPRLVLSLRTSSDPAVLTGPPAQTWPTTYSVWMTSPLGSGSGAGVTSGTVGGGV